MFVSSLRIDCSGFESEMCRLGRDFGCDRSPINEFTKGRTTPFRHAYTPVFDMLFARIRHFPVSIAEIGIAYGAGLRMLAAYFPAARIVGYERRGEFIEHCRALRIPRTEIKRFDLDRAESFEPGFDVVLEDSNHVEETQVRAIETIVPVLNPGGTLIIEDILERRSESALRRAVDTVEEYLVFASFVFPTSPQIDGKWGNDKLLVLVRG